MRKKLPIAVVLFIFSVLLGCASTPSKSWRDDCQWEEWFAYDTLDLGEETKTSLTWNITQGDIARVDVMVTYQSSFKKKSKLKRECCNPCQAHSYSVNDCISWDYKQNRCKQYGMVSKYQKREVRKREYKESDIYYLPNPEKKLVQMMTIGSYQRELVLNRVRGDEVWSIYQGEAAFRLGTDGASVSLDKPGAIPRDILEIRLAGKEIGKVYLYIAGEPVIPKSKQEKSDKEPGKGTGDWKKAIIK